MCSLSSKSPQHISDVLQGKKISPNIPGGKKSKHFVAKKVYELDW